MVPQISGKRAATSPLSSDFDKRPKLGLSDEELEELNTGLAYLAYLPVSILEHVTPQYLVLTFHETATHSSTIDKSWMDRNVCIKFVDRLQSEERLNFASMWIEGRREKDWSKYANYCAFPPSHRYAIVYRSFVQSSCWFNIRIPVHCLTNCYHVYLLGRASQVRLFVVF